MTKCGAGTLARVLRSKIREGVCGLYVITIVTSAG